jgi:hypothetical protein
VEPVLFIYVAGVGYMFATILKELKRHAPFTVFGALTGIAIMLLCYRTPSRIAFNVFYILHPIHVLLSAEVTASMYRLYMRKRVSIWFVIMIGYVGSIGIATLSDSVIPYLGEALLSLPDREIHLGFIERWWLVNPLAFLGIALAVYKPKTKFPHAGHVLLSTWASLFHIIMALGGATTLVQTLAIFVFLFFAVWIPCCVSDIVFPLLFVKERSS